MTFAIAPLGSVPGVDMANQLGGAGPVAGPMSLADITSASTGTTGAGFGNILTGAVENLQQVEQKADALAVRAVSGDLEDVHDYTIAASEAKLTMELTAAIRNKAVDAFNEVLRMQG